MIGLHKEILLQAGVQLDSLERLATGEAHPFDFLDNAEVARGEAAVRECAVADLGHARRDIHILEVLAATEHG